MAAGAGATGGSGDNPDDDRSRVVHPSGEQGVDHPGTGTLGVAIFCVSLGFLFAASLVAYLVIRFKTPWPPPGVRPLPLGMLFSTAVLIACSTGIQVALERIRKGDQVWLRRGLLGAFLFGLGFLIVQSLNWWSWLSSDVFFNDNPYAFAFFMLTGLHAVHILGGLIPLGVVTRRAFHGTYNWAYYPGVKQCAIYWHFLFVVWVILYSVLFITG